MHTIVYKRETPGLFGKPRFSRIKLYGSHVFNVTAAGALEITDINKGCVAVFAPGEWSRVENSEAITLSLDTNGWVNNY